MTITEAARSVRLTRRTVEGAEAGAGRYVLWDAELRGFGLRVEPSGSKTYLVRYRLGGGRRGTLKQFKIGSATKLTPDQARDLARMALARAEVGEDPQGERVAARATLTVSELCDLYLSEGCGTKKASTLKLDTIRLAVIKRLIGRSKITELDNADVARLMSTIASGKVAIKAAVYADADAHKGKEAVPGSRARGGRTAATKAVKLLRAIFNFAIARKLCAENPAKAVATFPDVHRERFLSPAELGRLGDALTAAEAEGANPYHVAIVRLLALTGARKNEIARLRWSEVRDGHLQLEDSKTGRKAIPLGAPAQALLASIDRTDSPWVFPDPRDPSLPIRNLDWAWVGIRKRAGLDEVRVHDLRHSFASVGVAGGATLFLIGKMLGHAHAATTHRYTHLADDPLRAAADRISATINSAMGAAPAQGVG